MSTTGKTDQITIHKEQNDPPHNDEALGDTSGDGNVVTGGDGTTGTAGVAGGAAGTTNFNLRVEQNKIPEFFGTKSKDTISAMDFIQRLEDLAKTNRWTDAQSYYHFANSLRNLAREWLSSMVDMDNEELNILLWTDFKDLFKQ